MILMVKDEKGNAMGLHEGDMISRQSVQEHNVHNA